MDPMGLWVGLGLVGSGFGLSWAGLDSGVLGCDHVGKVGGADWAGLGMSLGSEVHIKQNSTEYCLATC
jgi:hypothetical protein